MPIIEINYWAVLVGGLIQMVLGFLWYGPLFGKIWMKLSGRTKESIEAEKKGMGLSYFLMLVASLLTAYTLAHIVGYAHADTMMAGLQAGFWTWLGFIATTTLSSVFFDKKPWALYCLDNAYRLLSLLLMGWVLAVWQ